MPSVRFSLDLMHIERRYWLFGATIVLFQLAGYNAMTLSLLAFSLILLFSAECFFNNVQALKWFLSFCIGTLFIGLIKLFFNDASMKSLMMWGQFYLLCFALLGLKDRKQALQVLKIVVYLIFIGDLISNLLLMLGFDLPWSSLPPKRIGEFFPRFTGIKNNTLYSGSISFLALCFTLHERQLPKYLHRLLLAMMVFNLVLASSFRYYIALFSVVILIKFRLYSRQKLLKIGYVGTIILVILATWLTRTISLSNSLRWQLWNNTLDRITENPLSGIGFMFQELSEHSMVSYHNLAMSGVTESTILLIMLCFGLPMTLLFLAVIAQTLSRMRFSSTYSVTLGLFLSLSLDLFWGGSWDNILSLSLFLLSLYGINHEGYFLQRAEQYLSKEQREPQCSVDDSQKLNE
ncbi:MAG: O-antigen ligase family protein [Prevotella salivae]|uniref:O-antigen ligase family protein n=1 Tax=Segatella salivae TaxID=228604 RepID=UPI001CB4BB95|nr:O-antigen ligase family protein [Segatella salivae]MBF1543863.1 O-antigen ligase family protein [Segatella salivae]